MGKHRPVTAEEMEYIRHLYFDEYKGMQAIQKLTHRSARVICKCVSQLGKPRGLYERWKGEYNPNWKGGRRRNNFGYIDVYLPEDSPYSSMRRKGQKCYVVEHRLIMAMHLSRCLTKDEIVHHLNGIKDDNRISNLALVSRSNHPTKSFMKLLQKHVRELEAKLSQQTLYL